MEGLLAADRLLRVMQPRAPRSSPLVVVVVNVVVVVVRKIRARRSLMQGRGTRPTSRNETLDGRTDHSTVTESQKTQRTSKHRWRRVGYISTVRGMAWTARREGALDGG